MIVKRIKILAEALDTTVSGLEKALNLGNTTLSKAIAGEKSIGSTIIEKIFSTYPNVNPIWFLFGTGEVLLDEKPPAQKYLITEYSHQLSEPTPEKKSAQEKVIENLNDLLALKNEEIKHLKDQLKQKEKPRLKFEDMKISQRKKQVEEVLAHQQAKSRMALVTTE